MKEAHILRSVLGDLLPDHEFETEIQPDLIRVHFYKDKKETGYMVSRPILSDQEPTDVMDEAHWDLFRQVVKFISVKEDELSEL